MILKKFRKQPDERKDYDIDYSPWLIVMEDTIDNVDTIVECLDDPNDQSLIIESLAITNSLVKLWISGGTSGLTYKVTIILYTPAGRIDESELLFTVVDI